METQNKNNEILSLKNSQDNKPAFVKFIQSNNGLYIIPIATAITLYGVSKHYNYSNKKTAWVAIGGTVVVSLAVLLNGLSGMGGRTFLEKGLAINQVPKDINAKAMTKQAVPISNI